jgi:hypothetical protein
MSPAALTSLFDVRDDIVTALRALTAEIPDLVVCERWTPTPTPPVLDVYPGNPFQTFAGMGAGANQVYWTVRARVGTADDAAAQDTLLRLLDPADLASVERALEPLGVSIVEAGVTGYAEYADDVPVNERLLGCQWRVTTFL